MAKIDLSLITQLRERTGAGMMDCKNALIQADGDMEKAVELLRKKGASISAKRSSNATSEGLVHAYIHPGDKMGVLLEINCETDFVARTADVRKFAADVCLHIAAQKPLYISIDEVDPKFLEHEQRMMREQLASSGKPEKIINQIIEGKLQSLYSEICLLEQPFVKNDALTIAGLLQELIGKIGENIKIKRFARFEIGA